MNGSRVFATCVRPRVTAIPPDRPRGVAGAGARGLFAVAAVLLFAALLLGVFASLAVASPAASGTPAYKSYTDMLKHPFAQQGAKPAVAGTRTRVPSPLSRSHLGSVTAAAAGTGSISGKVTDDQGVGLPNVEVDVLSAESDFAASTTTGASGSYSFTGLPNEAVIVETVNFDGYLDEFYDNVPAMFDFEGTGATPLDLAATPTQTNIDFALDLGKTISGKVTDANGKGIADVAIGVVIEFPGGTMEFGGYNTAADGTYTVTGLPPGSYLVYTQNDAGFINKWYKNVVYISHPDGAGATPVDVTSANATGIDFTLNRGKSISGHVYIGTSPATHGWVLAQDYAHDTVATAEISETTGEYSITGLLAGSYKLCTQDTGGLDAWYAGDSIWADESGNSSPPIIVGSTNVTGKDLTLDKGATISGRVTNAFDLPLDFAMVNLQPLDGDFGMGMSTDEHGAYEFTGLPYGKYVVSTQNDEGFVDEWWNGIPVPGNLEGVGVDAVDVTSADQTHIDFRLEAGFTISGTLKDRATGELLTDDPMAIEVYDSAGTLYADTSAMMGDSGTGEYTTWALPAGTYYVEADDQMLVGYASQWYKDKPCGQYTLADATPVHLTQGNADHIDFALDRLTHYEQTDPHIAYTGAWSQFSAADSSGGSYAYSSSKTASATIYFTGTRLDLVAMCGITIGTVDIYLDGATTPETIDLAAPDPFYDLRVWTTGCLADGPHKVRIAPDAHNPTGKRITLDAVEVAGALTYAAPTITSISPSAGTVDGGSSVTITGTGFDGATVTFDGTASGPTAINSTGTQILCTTPAHAAGAVTVQVTTPAGSATTSFTYVVLPPVNAYDQSDGNIVKAGGWADYPSAGSTGGSYGRTATPGASATVWFNGSQIDWIAMEGITTGKADVYIDGVKLATVNLAASSPAYQQDVWSSPVLVPGLHSFKIVRSAGNAAGKFITLDGVNIAGTIVAPLIRYQQTDTHIVYTGAWSPFASAHASGSSYSRSLSDGASATITFTGTRLDVIATKGTTTGIVDIYLDGAVTPTATIDLTAAGVTYQFKLWSTGTLASGTHTVRLVRNAGSAATKYITLDAVGIWGTIQ